MVPYSLGPNDSKFGNGGFFTADEVAYRIGVAGVPRASLVILAATLASYNLPLEGITLILGVDALMDMGRTMTNVIGNCLATVVIAKWEKAFRNEEWEREEAELEEVTGLDPIAAT